MAERTLVLVGTKRGLFVWESSNRQAGGELRGPLANPGWAFGYATYNPQDGALYAAGTNAWFGAAIWKSSDLGATWALAGGELTYGDTGPELKEVWHLQPAHGLLYAGVAPAGLFCSADGGQSWAEVGSPLRSHPSARAWSGGKGGLSLQSIVPHPEDPAQLWAGMAGGGVMYTADGGRSWAPRNAGAGLRVQKLHRAVDGTLYQQSHTGVYRSQDGGLNWIDVTANLPSRFGFALALHPRDPQTAYTVPLINEGGTRFPPQHRLAVWRTRDGGRSWAPLTQGLADGPTYTGVLRQALSTDSSTPAGVYFGTGGHLYGSFDEGETFRVLAPHLPEILSVTAVTVS